MLNDMFGGYDRKKVMTVILLLILVIAFHNWIISLLSLILVVGVFLLTQKTIKERENVLNRYLDMMARNVDQASSYALQNLPIGIVIIDMKAHVQWCNSVFRDWFGDLEENHVRLQSVMPELVIDKIWGKSGHLFDIIEGRHYRILYKYLESSEEGQESYLVLYFDDITESELRKIECESALPVFAVIEIDNMEEVSKGMTDVQRASLWAGVNNTIIDEFSKVD